MPASGGQRATYNCSEIPEVASPTSDYKLLAEDVLNITRSGYHVFNIPHSKQLTVRPLDVIGWTSMGGQLRYVDNTSQRYHMSEYPVIGHLGSKLLHNNHLKMHFTSHALCAYVRQPVNFELTHAYSHSGVYQLTSTVTEPMSISVSYPITPFKLKFPRLFRTNATIPIKTGNHNGSLASYLWDFGDGTKISSSNFSITHIYSCPGWFSISLLATNPVSNYSLIAKIEILEPIRSCRFIRPNRPVVLGDPSYVEWQCMSGSNISFSFNFGDGAVAFFRTTSGELRGNVSHVYSSPGNFSVLMVMSSPVGPNVSVTGHALVEVPISGLHVRLSFTPQSPIIYVATSANITVERVLERGTHVICQYDFGDSTVSVFSSKPTIEHTYHQPGTYRVNVTCYNHVSSVWAMFNSSIVVQRAVLIKNISLSVVPTVLGAPSLFKLRIT